MIIMGFFMSRISCSSTGVKGPKLSHCWFLVICVLEDEYEDDDVDETFCYLS